MLNSSSALAYSNYLSSASIEGFTIEIISILIVSILEVRLSEIEGRISCIF